MRKTDRASRRGHNRVSRRGYDRASRTRDSGHAVLALLIVLSLVFTAAAALRPDAALGSAAVLGPEAAFADTVYYGDGTSYTNPETGYKAFINDDEDLLTDGEEEALLQEMIRLTDFGNVGFVSCYAAGTTTEAYAREEYARMLGSTSGSVLFIDMYNRIIQIHSNGAMYGIVGRSEAEAITDNIYKYASNGNYYACASACFSQIYELTGGGHIARPMKHITNALVAVTLAILINYIYVAIQRNKAKVNETKLVTAIAEGGVTADIAWTRVTKEVRVSSDSDSGGGGGGFSGGGGGGGSSGGGGGGGHSF